MKKLSYRTQELLSNLDGVPSKCFEDLNIFKNLLESLKSEASKKTHYHKLSEWSDKVYEFIHNKLKENGFKNGEPEVNDKNPPARFWWHIYGIMGSIHYSLYLKTEVANHHSSAFERNEALILEIEDIIETTKNI